MALVRDVIAGTGAAEDSIVFSIEPHAAGCAVTLRWSTANPPDERGIALALVRHRLNYAIGGELRDSALSVAP